MIKYDNRLQPFSRLLRNNMTEPEILLWSRLKNKQVLGLRFYRQKTLLSYIVDFYCHQAKLVVECDGSQHFEDEHMHLDQIRDATLASHNILVLRFDNVQIMQQLNVVMEHIWNSIRERQILYTEAYSP